MRKWCCGCAARAPARTRARALLLTAQPAPVLCPTPRCRIIRGIPWALGCEWVQVETELYGELKRDLGKNFKLFSETVNLKEWKKKGPYVPPEADMGSKRNAQAFPPLLTRWSLRQTKEVRICTDAAACADTCLSSASRCNSLCFPRSCASTHSNAPYPLPPLYLSMRPLSGRRHIRQAHPPESPDAHAAL